jgi:hypothetical protein
MVEIRMPDGRSARVNVSAAVWLAEADRLTQAIAQPSRVDPQVIEYFRRMLAEHYTGDKMLGPRQFLGTVMAQLEVLDTLRKQARPPVAKPLLRTLAQYAEFVGWLQQDYDLDTLDEQAATCYRNVGRPEDAIPILERKIAALPANLQRDHGHRMAKLANAVIATKQPEPDRAAQLGLACLDLARHTGSARISKELHTLHTALLTSLVPAPSTTHL